MLHRRSCWWPDPHCHHGRCAAEIAGRSAWPVADADAGGGSGGGGGASVGGFGAGAEPPRRLQQLPCGRGARGRDRGCWKRPCWSHPDGRLEPTELLLRPPLPAGGAGHVRDASGVLRVRDGRAHGGRGHERELRHDGDDSGGSWPPDWQAAPRACAAPAAHPAPGLASRPFAEPSPAGGPPSVGTSRTCSSGTCSTACVPLG